MHKHFGNDSALACMEVEFAFQVRLWNHPEINTQHEYYSLQVILNSFTFHVKDFTNIPGNDQIFVEMLQYICRLFGYYWRKQQISSSIGIFFLV